MSAADRPQFERQRYWSGQTLRSRDFRDQLSVENELRWWHNRALHTAYGIVEGLKVTPEDGEWKVDPGIAYDCYGRELLLQKARVTTLPSDTSESHTLLIRYCTGSLTMDRLHGCAAEEAELVWKLTRQFSVKDGVALGRIDSDGEVTSLEDFRPPSSRAHARPLIGNGATIAGKTNWQYWQYQVRDFDGNGSLDVGADGIEVTIDTSASGFTDIPCYFAWLHGGLLSRPDFASALSSVSPMLSNQRQNNGARVALDRIMSSKPDSFVFSLVNLSGRELLAFARRNLYVCWLGIQMASNEVNSDET